MPAIASLRERAESIRSGELAKAESRLEGLSESERRTVESIRDLTSRRSSNKAACRACRSFG